MSLPAPYRRPTLEEHTFRDAAGEVIAYGKRWIDSAEDASYGVTEHPERFAALTLIAESVVDFLAEHAAVRVEHGAAIPVSEGRDQSEHDQAVTHGTERIFTLTPTDDRIAAITVTITDLPQVTIAAGTHFYEAFPYCGCDACDEDVSALASELEDTIAALLFGDPGTAQLPQHHCARGHRPSNSVADAQLHNAARAALWAPEPSREARSSFSVGSLDTSS